jgi:hypothetical protein
MMAAPVTGDTPLENWENTISAKNIRKVSILGRSYFTLESLKLASPLDRKRMIFLCAKDRGCRLAKNFLEAEQWLGSEK